MHLDEIRQNRVTNLLYYSGVPDATAASEMPCKSSFSNLMFGAESASPIIRMIRPGTKISHIPNNTEQSCSGSVSMSHRKNYFKKEATSFYCIRQLHRILDYLIWIGSHSNW